jgi:trehalose 6-phosphate synthase
MRLLIISNRLPLRIERENGTFSYKQTSGGLVTGLICVKEAMEFLWIGNISGLAINEEEKMEITKDCWDKFRSVPVFISSELNDKSYNGFCNGILWPLIHTFPDDVSFSQTYWDAYVEYNQIFCDKICEIAQSGDIIWVHDYHLMILPGMLRERLKDVRIGFFLHTSFPSSDIFCVLPPRKEIIQGMMCSDLIAFHSYEYLAHFLSTCEKLLPTFGDYGNETKLRALGIIKDKPIDLSERIKYGPGMVNVGERWIRMKAIPIGIDPEIFRRCLLKEETVKRREEIRKKYEGKTIILGVDRIDYIKGIPNRIKGYQRFLEKYPDLRQRVVFLQIGVPSREDVTEYASMVSVVNEMVSEVNGKYGNVDDSYLLFLNKSVKFEELCALYSAGDCCIISSLRDGMNLVALEYIACQEENKGVLLLSEFAGCQTTLPAALVFSPWNIEKMADTIKEAVIMGKQERGERYEINKMNVEKFTAVKWATDNVNGIKSVGRGAIPPKVDWQT